MMNAERLLAHYERIADAPDAIPRLRRFVVNLAVRGKLIPQNSGDEPAVSLLLKIADDARNADAARVRRGQQNRPALLELPVMKPPGWAWAPFSDVAIIESNLVDPRNYQALPLIAPDNIESGTGRLLPYQTVGESGVFSAKHLFARARLLYSKIRPALAKVVVVTFDGLCSADMYPVRPLIDSGYLHKFMLSDIFIDQSVSEANRLAMPKVNQDSLGRILVAVPPLAEQRRIVAKVDELMSLCNQLAAARTEREAVRDRLTIVTLTRLNEPDPNTLVNDARFALDNLPALTDGVERIAELRQTILNLAVRGRLVLQDPSDKPASELLNQITAEKARLVNAGQIRGHNLLPPVFDQAPLFELPVGWTWARLGALIHLVSGQHLQPAEYSADASAGIPYITGPADFGKDGLRISRFALVRKAVAKRAHLLLTVKGAGVGKAAICDRPEVAISRQLMALAAIVWDQRYLILVTHLLAETLRGRARSLIPGISRKDVEMFVVGLPPLGEQQRIVAKVDELMALCDRLEASLAAGDDARRRLLDALLHEALEQPPTQSA